jgi:hypothetical protein
LTFLNEIIGDLICVVMLLLRDTPTVLCLFHAKSLFVHELWMMTSFTP